MRREQLDAWLRAHPVAVDSAGVLLATMLLVVLGGGVDPRTKTGLLMLGFVLPLALRRVAPMPVFAVVVLAATVQWAYGLPLDVANAGLLVALYTVAAYGSRVQSLVALGIGLVGVVLAIQRYVVPFRLLDVDFLVITGLFAGVVLAAWTSGDLRRTRLLHVAALRDRAEQLERGRDREMRLATAGERARIAREMHDVVAHGLSVIIVQADGARYASEHDPAVAREALATISATGRQSLTEMRRMLGLLRAAEDGTAVDGAPAEAAAAEREPQPGIAQVAQLVEQVRGAGVPVELEVRGEPRPLAASLELTAYRAVQESLTNVLKHGGPGTRAWVVLAYGEDELEVQVSDDGRGSAAAGDGQGHGLQGMRERVAVSGGRVRAGPRAGGGFEVVVRLPCPATAAVGRPSEGAP